MSSYKITFLINPVSGGGAGRKIFRFLPEIMNSFDFKREDWHAEFTDINDFSGQLKRLFELSDKLIAVGGDGTMNLVLSNIADFDVELGLIPLGTGNDLSRAMNVWSNYQKRGLLNTVRKFVNSSSKSFDIWKVNESYLLAAYLSIGMDAKVSHEFDRARSQGRIPIQAAWFNKLHYLMTFWKVKKHKLKIGTRVEYQTADNKWHSKDLTGHSSLLLGNVNSYGGGASPFGCCIYNDRFLHMIRIKGVLSFVLLMSTTCSKNWGTIVARFIMPTRQGKNFRVNVPEGEFVQIDGEDRTKELSGKLLNIEHVRQVKMLVLND